MTPPGGSRDDDNAPHGEPAPGPSRSSPPGSSPDDTPDDATPRERDPQLRAMRAVWLAMRDEDPPDRGLAQLLAAARHQAAAMQPPPSAWQRLLAALRRPAVLALATVTVLIAGAVLIGRRVPREASPGLTASRDEGAGPPLDHATTRTQQALKRGDALAVPPPTAAAPPPAVAPPPAAAPPPTAASPPDRDRVPPVPPAHRARTTAPAPSSSAKMPPGEARSDVDDRAPADPAPAAPEPAPPPPEQVTQLGASAAVPGDGTSGANNARNAAPPARPALPTQSSGSASNDTANRAAHSTANNAANNAASPVANGAGSPVTNHVAPARRPSPASPRSDVASDPYRQCEAAAGRGDCVTVRRLVGQITRTDPGYRARVAKDSPVGKCLAE